LKCFQIIVGQASAVLCSARPQEIAVTAQRMVVRRQLEAATICEHRHYVVNRGSFKKPLTGGGHVHCALSVVGWIRLIRAPRSQLMRRLAGVFAPTNADLTNKRSSNHSSSTAWMVYHLN